MAGKDETLQSGWGSGSHLPLGILATTLVCSLLATALSLFAILLQLKNYRSVHLQRWVVRILVMVPIYAIASAVSLFSNSIAFYLDAIRDCYEAFVIYCFFSLLVEFLGGERALIMSLAGRPPTSHSFPFDRCLPPVDMSDPFAFLAVKRGILQYTQIKPILAFITMILKATGSYTEGTLKADNAYTYLAIVYNISISVALYSLVLFWKATHRDLQPFRPTPKFLSIKGILFSIFWQSFFISILVSTGAIKLSGYSTDDAALAISDALICCEMPLFALSHLYSFCRSSDYVDESLQHAGRLPLSYALKDSLFGYKDVVHDALITFKGKGFSYSTFESSESAVHSGVARANRARAGLRYADGGKTKYWLPLPGEASRDKDVSKRNWKTFLRHPVDGLQSVFEQERLLEQGYSPLTSEQANRVVHDDPRVDLPGPSRPSPVYDLAESDTSSLEFDAPEISDDDLYNDARQLEFGDWRYPVYDATKEAAQRRRYEEEDEILFGRPPTSSSSRVDRKGKKREVIQTPTVLFPSATERFSSQGKSKESAQLPDGCVDLVVEDKDLEDEREQLERTKGDVTNLAGKERRAWRQLYGSPDASSSSRRPFLPEDHQTVEYTADDRESAQEDIVNQPQQFEESLTLATEVEPPKEAEKFVAPGSYSSNPWR